MLPLSENALDRLVADEKNRGAPPLTDWDSLSARLRSEGLIRESFTSRFTSSPLLKIAAALVLAAGGVAAGRASAGAPVIPTVSSVAAGSAVASDPGLSSTAIAGASSAESSNASLASNAARFSSAEEAWDVLNRAGEEYQQASAYLAESNSAMPVPQSTAQYRTRLAALDNVMSEMRDAMRQAPQDPVINQYYMATAGAREATLRQLGTVLPASARMNRF